MDRTPAEASRGNCPITHPTSIMWNHHPTLSSSPSPSWLVSTFSSNFIIHSYFHFRPPCSLTNIYSLYFFLSFSVTLSILGKSLSPLKLGFPPPFPLLQKKKSFTITSEHHISYSNVTVIFLNGGLNLKEKIRLQTAEILVQTGWQGHTYISPSSKDILKVSGKKLKRHKSRVDI